MGGSILHFKDAECDVCANLKLVHLKYVFEIGCERLNHLLGQNSYKCLVKWKNVCQRCGADTTM